MADVRLLFDCCIYFSFSFYSHVCWSGPSGARPNIFVLISFLFNLFVLIHLSGPLSVVLENKKKTAQ